MPATLAVRPVSEITGDTADVAALLLADKRSEQTRRAYAADLRGFFGGDPTPDTVRAFLALPVPQIALALNTYKARMMAAGHAEATVNRRLAAVRSLLKLAHRLGYCATDGGGLVDGETVTAYRDTRGIELKQMRALVRLPAKLHGNTVRGLRDTALLRLLCENALRRAEVCGLDVAHFDAKARRLSILGKGRGSQREAVTVSSGVAGAVTAYLLAAGHIDGALFRNVAHNSSAGARLTPDGLYTVVGEYGAELGLKRLTPHQLRHSAITAALDATGGDVRQVQKLSRHARVETLMRYDDNRADLQGDVTNKLAGLLK